MDTIHDGRIAETTVAGVNVFAVSGVLDCERAESVRDRIGELAASGADRFVVDLSSVEGIDPYAVIVLLESARSARGLDGRVSIVFDPLLAVFTVAGLEDFFDVAVTRDDAVTRICA